MTLRSLSILSEVVISRLHPLNSHPVRVSMMGQYHNSSFVIDDTQPLGDWSLWALTYSILAVIPFTLFYLLQASGGSNLPTLNSKRAFEFSDKRVKRNFRVNGRQLLREGLEKFNGQPFRILTDHGPTIILPPSYAQEIRNLGDLNHVKAIAKVSCATPMRSRQILGLTFTSTVCPPRISRF